MGNSLPTDCETIAEAPIPDPINVCSESLNDEYVVEDFCSKAGSGASVRNTWCGYMSTGDEWKPKNADGLGEAGCHYNSCGSFQAVPGDGCCGTCCGIAGTGLTCVRKSFTGNPVECCIKDLACNMPEGIQQQPAACYSDNLKQNTCDPCYRDITSTGSTVVPDGNGGNTTCARQGKSNCQELMLNYCTGADTPGIDIQTLTERWYLNGDPTQPGPATIALERILLQNLPSKCLARGAIPYTGVCKPLYIPGTTITSTVNLDGSSTTAGTPTTALSAEGVAWAQQMFPALIATYNSLGYSLGSVPGTIGYNPFQDYLYSLCCQIPVMCQSSLNSACAIYSAQSLSVNPDATNWCGCYLADSEYQIYVDTYQINKQCTPTCNRNTTIPIVNQANAPLYCNQNICLIDDVTINLSNTTVGGGINISQICGNCSGGFGAQSTCSCIVENNTIDAAQSNLGSINLNSSCTSTTCQVTNPGFPGMPPTLDVPCDQTSDPTEVYSQAQAALLATQAAENKNTIIVYLVIILIFLIIMFFLYYLIRPYLLPSPPDRIVYPRAPPPKTAPVPEKPPTSLGNSAIGTKSVDGANSFASSNIGTKLINEGFTGGNMSYYSRQSLSNGFYNSDIGTEILPNN